MSVLSNTASLHLFSPESVLTAGILLLVVWDLLARGASRKSAGALTLLTLAGSVVATIMTTTDEPHGLFGGLMARDGFGDFFKVFFAITAAIVGIMAMRSREAIDYHDGDRDAAEFYALTLTVVLGLNLMATATDLLMIYLAVEVVSILSYILAGFTRKSRRSAEASLKYVIYGGVASGVMLYGLSIFYGLAGSTDLAKVQAALATSPNITASILAVCLTLAGLGFKIAVVPFHMWCPDVYEGAPLPITAFLSVGPKAAGFALLVRFAAGGLPDQLGGGVSASGYSFITPLVAAMAVLTMTWGNLAALGQNNLKRMLAYSSIAHAGYLLLGVSAGTQEANAAILFYLVAYLIMNLGAFLVILGLSEGGLGETLDDYKGLGYRNPYHAAVLGIFMVSLTGIPPMMGFIGKFYLFAALLNRGGMLLTVVAIIGVLNSAVSLYYYARVLKAMYLDSPADPRMINVPNQHSVMLFPLAAATLLLGIYWTPVYDWASSSLAMWLPSAAPVLGALRP